jgi:uncharacterized membrane protein
MDFLLNFITPILVFGLILYDSKNYAKSTLSKRRKNISLVLLILIPFLTIVIYYAFRTNNLAVVRNYIYYLKLFTFVMALVYLCKILIERVYYKPE